MLNNYIREVKSDLDFQISDLVKNPDGTDIEVNRCGEFQWSSEGLVNQIHSPHFHAGAPGIFSALLRSVQMLWECGVRKATGN